MFKRTYYVQRAERRNEGERERVLRDTSFSSFICILFIFLLICVFIIILANFKFLFFQQEEIEYIITNEENVKQSNDMFEKIVIQPPENNDKDPIFDNENFNFDDNESKENIHEDEESNEDAIEHRKQNEFELWGWNWRYSSTESTIQTETETSTDTSTSSETLAFSSSTTPNELSMTSIETSTENIITDSDTAYSSSEATITDFTSTASSNYLNTRNDTEIPERTEREETTSETSKQTDFTLFEIMTTNDEIAKTSSLKRDVSTSDLIDLDMTETENTARKFSQTALFKLLSTTVNMGSNGSSFTEGPDQQSDQTSIDTTDATQSTLTTSFEQNSIRPVNAISELSKVKNDRLPLFQFDKEEKIVQTTTETDRDTTIRELSVELNTVMYLPSREIEFDINE